MAKEDTDTGTQQDWDKYKHQRWKLYTSYAFSSWGDRMWMFAVGLALASIGNDLRLPAIYGFICGVGVLLWGASVGGWIDRTPRLTAASRCLLVNNLSVALASASLVCLLYWHDRIQASQGAYVAVITLAILLTAVSELASSGSKIVISRDWVVVLCFGDSAMLANTNAVMLRINLTAMILSPLIAGQIMTSFNMAAGCLFISVWNVLSYFVENYLLWSIYKNVPQLAVKSDSKPIEMTALTTGDGGENGQPEKDNLRIRKSSTSSSAQETPKRSSNLLLKLKLSVYSVFRGWKIYRAQPVFEAGLALGLLYMTVLGLDSITTAFAYAQGLQENVLAIVRGVGALIGISGSFAFPKFRQHLGLPRTGLVSLMLQLSALSLCVISIWLPGSPFDVVGYFTGHSDWMPFRSDDHVTSDLINITIQIPFNSGVRQNETFMNHSSINMTRIIPKANSSSYSVVSIWTFLAGVCFARFGLWMVDLSISQIYQETIPEDKRGIVSGVQNSINRSMDMLKSILVISLPSPMTFGLLIIASFSAIASGAVCYCIFVLKQSKYATGELAQIDAAETCASDGLTAATKDATETGKLCEMHNSETCDSIGKNSDSQTRKFEDSCQMLNLADMTIRRASLNPSQEDVNILSDLIRKEGSNVV